uniref:Uncharacterized protein n=1 Tax=Timema shepardi TaxID=629360 RepID=A0A7R9B653_TIMSH|nr:unnamed protein product [Timema shepardi]
MEMNQEPLPQMLAGGLTEAEKKYPDIKFDQVPVVVSREDEEESLKEVCTRVSAGVSAVLDLTWTGWSKAKIMSHGSKIPYFRGDVTPGTYVAAVDSYLTGRKATDAALIFQTEDELDQTLYYLIGKSIIRVIVLNGLDGNATDRLLTMRPSPSYFVIYATSKNMTKLYSKVQYLNSTMYSKRYSTTRVSCRARYSTTTRSFTAEYSTTTVDSKVI